MHGKSEQRSLFSIIERGATCKGFPEPEVSACEQPPTQPPRQRLSLDGLPENCENGEPTGGQ